MIGNMKGVAVSLLVVIFIGLPCLGTPQGTNPSSQNSPENSSGKHTPSASSPMKNPLPEETSPTNNAVETQRQVLEAILNQILQKEVETSKCRGRPPCLPLEEGGQPSGESQNASDAFEQAKKQTQLQAAQKLMGGWQKFRGQGLGSRGQGPEGGEQGTGIGECRGRPPCLPMEEGRQPSIVPIPQPLIPPPDSGLRRNDDFNPPYTPLQKGGTTYPSAKPAGQPLTADSSPPTANPSNLLNTLAKEASNPDVHQTNVDRSQLALRQEAIQRLTNLWYDEANGFMGWAEQLNRILRSPEDQDAWLSAMRKDIFPRREINKKGGLCAVKQTGGQTTLVTGIIEECFQWAVVQECKTLLDNVRAESWAVKTWPAATAFCRSVTAPFEVLANTVANARPAEDILSATGSSNIDDLYKKMSLFQNEFKKGIETLKKFPSFPAEAAAEHSITESLLKTLPALLEGLSQTQQERFLTRLCMEHPRLLPCSMIPNLLSSLSTMKAASPKAFSKTQTILSSFLLPFLQTPIFLHEVSYLIPSLMTDLIAQKPFSSQTWQTLQALFKKDVPLLGYDYDPSLQQVKSMDINVFNNLAKMGCDEHNPSFYGFLSASGYSSLQALQDGTGTPSAQTTFQKAESEIDAVLRKIPGVSPSYSLGQTLWNTTNKEWAFPNDERDTLSQKAGLEIAVFILKVHALVLHRFNSLKLLLISALLQDPKTAYTSCSLSAIEDILMYQSNFKLNKEKSNALLFSDLSPKETQALQTFLNIQPFLDKLSALIEALPLPLPPTFCQNQKEEAKKTCQNPGFPLCCTLQPVWDGYNTGGFQEVLDQAECFDSSSDFSFNQCTTSSHFCCQKKATKNPKVMLPDKDKPPFLDPVTLPPCLKYEWNPTGDEWKDTCAKYIDLVKASPSEHNLCEKKYPTVMFPYPARDPEYIPCKRCTDKSYANCDQSSTENMACTCSGKGGVSLGTLNGNSNILIPQNSLFMEAQAYSSGPFVASYNNTTPVHLPDSVFPALLTYITAQFQNEWLMARLTNEMGLCLERKIQSITGQESHLWENSSSVKTWIDTLTDYLQQYAQRKWCPLNHQVWSASSASAGSTNFSSPISDILQKTNNSVSSISFTLPPGLALSPPADQLLRNGASMHTELGTLFDLKEGQALVTSCADAASQWFTPPADSICTRILEYLNLDLNPPSSQKPKK